MAITYGNELMKVSLLALTAAAGLALAGAANAQNFEGPSKGSIVLDVRATIVDPQDGDPILTAANVDTGLDAKVGSYTTPTLGIRYFLTDNVAAELILGTSQHKINATTTPVGKTWVLPPTLTVQYHFMPNDTAIRPYVGAGVNYTNFSSVNLPGDLNVKRSSFGWALQAGMDIPLNKQWSLNVDVKKVQIKAEVEDSTGAGLGSLKVDPLLIGVGLGYRF